MQKRKFDEEKNCLDCQLLDCSSCQIVKERYRYAKPSIVA